MEENQKPIPTKTTVALSKDVISRLRSIMAYGDTYSTGVKWLLDFHDKWKGVVDNVKFKEGDSKE